MCVVDQSPSGRPGSLTKPGVCSAGVSPMSSDLTCFRCGSDFQTSGGNSGCLFECDECGTSLRRDLVEEIAGDGGALGELAEALLDRANAPGGESRTLQEARR